MPEKNKKQLERDKLSRDAAKELKKMKKKEGLLITLKVGDLIKSKSPSQKAKQKKKKPLGLKGGQGTPARTEKPGVPHGVDKKDSKGVTILEVAKGGSVKKFPDLSGDGKVTQKDILMGRGVVKKAMGGQVNGLKKMGMKVGGLAGRLAQRGYGKARR